MEIMDPKWLARIMHVIVQNMNSKDTYGRSHIEKQLTFMNLIATPIKF